MAYANVNPWKTGQEVNATERVWSVRGSSGNLRVRYIARYRAKNEQGDGRWWVNAQSTYGGDRDRPWGFVSAECIFAK